MGFSCPKFANKAPALLFFSVLSGVLCVQAQSQNDNLSRQEQQGQGQPPQESQPQKTVQKGPTQSSAQTMMPAPANQSPASQPGNATLHLTFQAALELARKNSTQFQAAVTNFGVIRADRAQARDALLPSVNYDNSAIYTQGSGSVAAVAGAPPVVFIANNAVHEYLSQANVHEAIDVAAFANWRRSAAAAAVARAQMEMAARGLVVTVAQNYYKVGAAELKLETARRGAEEGDRFFKLTQDLEGGGEVAHADVIKAELQMQERRRQLQEAQLGLLNARLDLAVLIFPNFNLNFEIADDLHAAAPLPTIEDIQQRGTHDNPDLRAALEAVRQARYDVFSARAGYLPALTFDYFYGIDAPNFGVNTVVNPGNQKFSNLGSSAVVTLNIPIWNWGSTQSKVRQAELKRDQAKRELSLAQRKLVAEIQSLYAEAGTAFLELEGLRRSGELAEESLRLVTLRYKNGESTVLEVVDAQTTFATTNSAYQDGALRYRVALASLQTLTGVSTNP
jgi:outer membrane protein TolC